MKLRTWMAAPLAVALLATACGGADVEDVADDVADTASEIADDASEAMDGDMDRSDWPEKLTFGFVPSREADQLVESADALAAVLSDALGIEVDSFVSQDYAALTEAMASGQADIGAFGPLGVVRAIDTAGVEFVLQSARFGSFTYHTQYMTNDPDTFCLDEVVTDEDGNSYCNGTMDATEGPVGEEAIALIDSDTTLAYVDPTSTSGYLIPALQMREQGIDLDSLNSTFAGGHDVSVQAVYDGDVTVGLSFDDARSTIAEQFPDVGEKVVVFAYSQEIPNDGFVIRSELPDSLKQAVIDALLAYSETEEGATVLDELYEIGGLLVANEADLDVIRRADAELGDTFGG
jgi:phosphonate transport system substrate-binding protein